MRRLLLAASLVLAVSVGAGASSPARPARDPVRADQRHCVGLFTVEMAKRAADAVYRGTREPSRANWLMLARIARCQRNPQAAGFVRGYYRADRAAWVKRRYPPWNGPSAASWFDDQAQSTACGFTATYGFASRTLPCGTRVTFQRGGTPVTGIVEDYGPAGWTGRDFDMNPGLWAAVGCPDTPCWVYWRRVVLQAHG